MENRQRQYQGNREYQGNRNMARRAGGVQKGRGRSCPYSLILCILLAANIIFSLYLQIQVRNVKDMLNQLKQSGLHDPSMSGAIVSGSLQDWYGSSKDLPAVSQKIPDTSADFDSGDGSGDGQAIPSGSVLGKEDTRGNQSRRELDYVELCGLEEVERPVKRTEREVLQRLRELARDSELIKEIYDNADDYSKRMLEALANNPEMADFIAGFPEAEKKAQGGFTDSEKDQEYPLFLQWDPRWGYVEYGDDGSIGLAGCGPTCLSMVFWYLLEDESLTPDFIAEYSMRNGYYVWGAGTAWALLEELPAMYGVDVWQPGISEERMKEALDQGCLLICSMSEGDFTVGGHFIVIYGYDRNGFKVNDSNCVARSRKRWSYEEIGDQIKQVWSYAYGDGRR